MVNDVFLCDAFLQQLTTLPSHNDDATEGESRKRKQPMTNSGSTKEGNSDSPSAPKQPHKESQPVRCSPLSHDHSYINERSPRKLKKQMDKLIDNKQKINRRLRASQKKANRMKTKVAVCRHRIKKQQLCFRRVCMHT